MRRTKIPSTLENLKRYLKNEQNSLSGISDRIKIHTDNWVETQRKIIDLEETISKLE